MKIAAELTTRILRANYYRHFELDTDNRIFQKAIILIPDKTTLTQTRMIARIGLINEIDFGKKLLILKVILCLNICLQS